MIGYFLNKFSKGDKKSLKGWHYCVAIPAGAILDFAICFPIVDALTTYLQS